jgi:hypothetical protein
MVNTATVPEEQHFILSSLSPGPAQKRLALAVIVSLLIIFFITAGRLSAIQTARLDAFPPAYVTAMFVNDSITTISRILGQPVHPAPCAVATLFSAMPSGLRTRAETVATIGMG